MSVWEIAGWSLAIGVSLELLRWFCNRDLRAMEQRAEARKKESQGPTKA